MNNNPKWSDLSKDLIKITNVIDALINHANNLIAFTQKLEPYMQSLQSYCIRDYFSNDVALRKLATKLNISEETSITDFLKQRPILNDDLLKPGEEVVLPTYKEFLSRSDQVILEETNACRHSSQIGMRSHLEKLIPAIAALTFNEKTVTFDNINTCIYHLLYEAFLINIHMQQHSVVYQIYAFKSWLEKIKNDLQASTKENSLFFGKADREQLFEKMDCFERKLAELREEFPRYIEYLDFRMASADINESLLKCQLTTIGAFLATNEAVTNIFKKTFQIDWNRFYQQDPAMTFRFINFLEQFQIHFANHRKNLDFILNFYKEQFPLLHPFFTGISLDYATNSTVKMQKPIFSGFFAKKYSLGNQKKLNENLGNLLKFVNAASANLENFLLPKSNMDDNSIAANGNNPVTLAEFFNFIKNNSSRCFKNKAYDFINGKSTLLILPYLIKIRTRYLIQLINPNNAVALITKDVLDEPVDADYSKDFRGFDLLNCSDVHLLAKKYNLKTLSPKLNTSIQLDNYLTWLQQQQLSNLNNDPTEAEKLIILDIILQSLPAIIEAIYTCYSYLYFGIKHCNSRVQSRTIFSKNNNRNVKRVFNSSTESFDTNYNSLSNLTKMRLTFSNELTQLALTETNTLSNANPFVANLDIVTKNIDSAIDETNKLSQNLSALSKEIYKADNKNFIDKITEFLNNPLSKFLLATKGLCSTASSKEEELSGSIPQTTGDAFIKFFTPLEITLSPPSDTIAAEEIILSLKKIKEKQKECPFGAKLFYDSRFIFCSDTDEEISIALNDSLQKMIIGLASRNMTLNFFYQKNVATEKNIGGFSLKSSEKDTLLKVTQLLNNTLAVKLKPTKIKQKFFYYVLVTSEQQLQDQKNLARELQSDSVTALTVILEPIFAIEKITSNFNKTKQLEIKIKVATEEEVEKLTTYLNDEVFVSASKQEIKM